MNKLLAGVLCGLASLPAFAADKWVIGSATKTYVLIVDVSTIETDGNIKSTWVVQVFDKPMDGYDYIVSWDEFDCKTRKTRSTDTTSRVFGMPTREKWSDTDWERVEPGSVGSATLDTVCKGKTTGVGKYETIEQAAKAIRDLSAKAGY